MSQIRLSEREIMAFELYKGSNLSPKEAFDQADSFLKEVEQQREAAEAELRDKKPD